MTLPTTFEVTARLSTPEHSDTAPKPFDGAIERFVALTSQEQQSERLAETHPITMLDDLPPWNPNEEPPELELDDPIANAAHNLHIPYTEALELANNITDQNARTDAQHQLDDLKAAGITTPTTNGLDPRDALKLVVGTERNRRLTEAGYPDLDGFLNQPEPEYDWLIPGLLERRDRVILTGNEGKGKALALDTPIATVNGWTTMGAIRIGELVFGPDGRPVRVLAATEVMYDRPCYSITLSTGATFLADAEHDWPTETLKAREAEAAAARRGPTRARGTDQRHLRRHFPALVTTVEIAETLEARGGFALNHAIACTAPLKLPSRALPIPPYTLGAWLGDGHNAGGRITCHDPEIVAGIRSEGFEVTSSEAALGNHGILGLQTLLRGSALLHAKRIPAEYTRASVTQRLELLRGIVDTDGYVGPDSKVEIALTCEELAQDVYDLMLGLGIKTTIAESRATLNGRDVGPRWRVAGYTDLPVATVERKAARLRPISRRTRLRYIVRCQPTLSIPVRCIQVEGGVFLAGRELVPTGNSTLLRQFGIQTAAGIHPFTLQPIGARRVLYIDLENPRALVRRKMRSMRLSAGKQLLPGFFIPVIWPAGINVLDGADRRRLEDLVDLATPDLLILGPLYKLADGDPSSEETGKPVSRVLDQIREEHDLALLLEAHSPYANQGKRPERPYGWSGWSRWPEFGLHLTDTGQLNHWRGARDERDWPPILTRGGEWPWTATDDTRAVTFAAILQHTLEDGKRLTDRELARRLNTHHSTIARAIKANQKQYDHALASLDEGDQE